MSVNIKRVSNSLTILYLLLILPLSSPLLEISLPGNWRYRRGRRMEWRARNVIQLLSSYLEREVMNGSLVQPSSMSFPLMMTAVIRRRSGQNS
jgi:hypothetical protein